MVLSNPLAHAGINLFLIQLVIIIVVSRALSVGFKYIHQPVVVAEIVTGVLLGPSVLGNIPGYMSTLFPTDSLPLIEVVADIGLICFMFIIGLEMNIEVMKRVKKFLVIAAASMLLPFVLGIFSAFYLYTAVVDKNTEQVVFIFFIGVATSITAFSVLARMLAEMKLLTTTVGLTAIGVAAIDDVTAWCLLAGVVSFQRHAVLDGVLTLGLLLIFVAFMFLIMRPLLMRVASYSNRHGHTEALRLPSVLLILLLMFFCAWVTDSIGVHPIFGAFILGVITPRNNRFAKSISERIEDLIVIVFLPLYFTYSGLRTDMASLDAASGLAVVIVFLTACIGKIGGGFIASKIMGETWRDSLTIGVLMNTRGLVELIVLNIGLDVKIINEKVFTIFIVMALLTTFMTSPLVYFIFVRKHQAQEGILMTSRNSPTTGAYSVLVCFLDPEHAAGLLTVATALNPPKATKVTCCHILEDSDRPSNFFENFSGGLSEAESESLVDNADEGGSGGGNGTAKPPPTLAYLEQHANTLGVTIRPVSLRTSRLEKDINKLVIKTKSNIVLCMNDTSIDAETQLQQHEQPSFTRTLQKIRSNASNVLDKGLTKVFGMTMFGSNADKLIHSTESMVAVLTDKGVVREEGQMQRVLFTYEGQPYERACLDAIAHIAKSVNVNVLTNVKQDREWDQFVRHNKLIVRISEEPVGTALREVDEEYELLILVLNREYNSPERTAQVAEILKVSPISVLILYPPIITHTITPTEINNV